MADIGTAEAGISPSETQQIEQSVGDKQTSLGKEWASIYADSNRPLVRSAEIILRNPAVYARDIDKLNLPQDIKDEWESLSTYADSLVSVAAIEPVTPDPKFGGLDKLQGLVFTTNVNPAFRRSIADVMETSSNLFSKSVAIEPGNTKYFEGNIAGAEGWIKQHQEATKAT